MYEIEMNEFAITKFTVRGFAMNEIEMNEFAMNEFTVREFAMNEFSMTKFTVREFAMNEIEMNEFAMTGRHGEFCDKPNSVRRRGQRCHISHWRHQLQSVRKHIWSTRRSRHTGQFARSAKMYWD